MRLCLVVFVKWTTAYGLLRRLVGSVMCIRVRAIHVCKGFYLVVGDGEGDSRVVVFLR